MNFESLAFVANTIVIGNALAGMTSIVFWILAHMRGVPVTKVQFFYGPSKCLFKFSGTEIELGTIPFGSSAHFDVPLFRAQPLLWRILVLLSGSVVLMVLSMATLGAEDAWRHFLNGFGELIQAALRPTSTAPHLIAEFHQVYNHSLLQAIGILAAKITAFSLFPAIGPMFVHIVREIVARDENRVLEVLMTLHAFLLFLLAGIWSFAMVRYALT